MGVAAAERFTFLSTLSLRRATSSRRASCSSVEFLSTLSLRRATQSTYAKLPRKLIISIHALLAESDMGVFEPEHDMCISIHALLAESDHQQIKNGYRTVSFLSTLSLRRATQGSIRVMDRNNHFYPRSPCGERLEHNQARIQPNYFYPRSPCGERRACTAQQPERV